mmetsp:Transcript_30813/g.63512  ORF Transcript_30813/g.63512 Transcript_30813/m.63512 type:complete len:350 (+) Transcript_30813:1151-2200(+)
MGRRNRRRGLSALIHGVVVLRRPTIIMMMIFSGIPFVRHEVMLLVSPLIAIEMFLRHEFSRVFVVDVHVVMLTLPRRNALVVVVTLLFLASRVQQRSAEVFLQTESRKFRRRSNILVVFLRTGMETKFGRFIIMWQVKMDKFLPLRTVGNGIVTILMFEQRSLQGRCLWPDRFGNPHSTAPSTRIFVPRRTPRRVFPEHANPRNARSIRLVGLVSIPFRIDGTLSVFPIAIALVPMPRTSRAHRVRHVRRTRPRRRIHPRHPHRRTGGRVARMTGRVLRDGIRRGGRREGIVDGNAVHEGEAGISYGIHVVGGVGGVGILCAVVMRASREQGVVVAVVIVVGGGSFGCS